MPKKLTPEFRDRAVRMVFDRQTTEGGHRRWASTFCPASRSSPVGEMWR